MLPKKFVFMAILVVGLFVMAALANGANIGSSKTDGCTDECGGDCSDCSDPCTSQSTPQTDGASGGCEDEPIIFTDGNQGTIEVPMVGIATTDMDAKHHFTVPEGVTKVEVTFTWEPAWALTIDIGTGECPHNGEVFASKSDSTGKVTLVYEAAEGLPTGTWFAHLSPNDASSHRGESCSYTLSAAFCNCDGDCGDCGSDDDCSGGGCGGPGGC